MPGARLQPQRVPRRHRCGGCRAAPLPRPPPARPPAAAPASSPPARRARLPRPPPPALRPAPTRTAPRTARAGSDDHTARVWDLRKKGCLYTIPAHSSLLSTVRFEPTAGSYLLTASYDALAKVGGVAGVEAPLSAVLLLLLPGGGWRAAGWRAGSAGADARAGAQGKAAAAGGCRRWARRRCLASGSGGRPAHPRPCWPGLQLWQAPALPAAGPAVGGGAWPRLPARPPHPAPARPPPPRRSTAHATGRSPRCWQATRAR